MSHGEGFRKAETCPFPEDCVGMRLWLQEGQGAGGFLVHEPRQSTGPRPDDLSRKRVRLIRPLKHSVECFGFCAATDEKRDLSGVIEKNRGEGDPGRLQRFHPGGDDEAARFMKGRGAREQGGGVTVRSHAQQDEIETRYFRSGDAELPPQHGFISVRNDLSIRDLTRHAMNLRLGDGQMAEERFMGHSIIAVRMIRRDVPFISPKKPDSRPIELTPERWGGKSGIETFRGRASGEGEGK